MKKHTPGPWRLSEDCGVCEGMGCFLVMTPANLRAEGEGIVCGVVEIDQQVWPEIGCAEANARLIAAAPDLLAALELANDELCRATWHLRSKTPKSVNEAVDVARAAIAKAKGT